MTSANQLSHSEENYLKAVYALTPAQGAEGISTSDIAERLKTKASSVTDMVQKLADKELLNYKKYQGVQLTNSGKKAAIEVVRKHRLWETFLKEKLGFGWDEVHEIAEQLEHIQSEELVERLDNFLGFPKYDPHGDPIPDPMGRVQKRHSFPISELTAGQRGVITGVRDSSSAFLQYLDKQQLVLGTEVLIEEVFDYDHSVRIHANNKEMTLSHEVSKNIKLQVKS